MVTSKHLAPIALTALAAITVPARAQSEVPRESHPQVSPAASEPEAAAAKDDEVAPPVPVPAEYDSSRTYGSPEALGYGPPPPTRRVPPPPQRTAYLHDGFYFRLSSGGGSMSASLVPKSQTEIEMSGSAYTFDFALGGTPVDGLVLGGRISHMTAPAPNIEMGPYLNESDGYLGMSTLQFFTDVYPWPEEGLHFMGAFGTASLAYTPQPNATRSDSLSSSGWSYGVGGGWDFWIARQWSFGGMLMLQWAKISDRTTILVDNGKGSLSTLYQGDADISVFVPTLAFTATYH